MAEALVVVGAGGLGREVVDVVAAVNAASESRRWDLLGVLDDAPSPLNLSRLERRGVTYLGETKDTSMLPADTKYVVGVGSAAVRRLLAGRLDAAGFRAATLVHPTATFGADCRVGEGTVAFAGARVTTNVELGRHVHLNLNCTVGHDCVLGDFVSLNPLASVSGDCTVGDEVLVGVGAVVLQGLSVARGATVGGNACVVKDVPPDVVVKGVPAR